MSAEYSQLELKRNNHYRDAYRVIVTLLVFLTIIGIVLVSILGYMSMEQKQPKYYATTTSGDVTPLYSMSEPVVTNNYLMKWSSLVALGVLSLSFGQVDKQLQTQKVKFTSDGWKKLQAAFDRGGFLKDINNNKVITSAVVDGPVVIPLRAVISGHYTWYVQVPVLVNFTSANQARKKKMLISMTIMRVPVLDSGLGIQVNSFILRGRDV